VLDVLVELGYVGGFVFIAFMARLLVDMWRRSRDLVFPVLIAVIIANMFDDILYFPRNGFAVAALVGLAGVASSLREPKIQTRTAGRSELDVGSAAAPIRA
jgi:hypothetical protein